MEMNYLCKVCKRYCIEGMIELAISRWANDRLCFSCFDKQDINNKKNEVIIYGFWNEDKVIGRMILKRLLNQHLKLLPSSTIGSFQELIMELLMKMAKRPRKHTSGVYNGSIIFPNSYLSPNEELLLDWDGSLATAIKGVCEKARSQKINLVLAVVESKEVEQITKE